MTGRNQMDISKDVRDFIVTNFIFSDRAGSPGADDSFIEMGIIDSTGVLEIVHFLESRYGITVADDEIVPENLDSIHNIVRFVNSKSAVPSGK